MCGWLPRRASKVNSSRCEGVLVVDAEAVGEAVAERDDVETSGRLRVRFGTVEAEAVVLVAEVELVAVRSPDDLRMDATGMGGSNPA